MDSKQIHTILHSDSNVKDNNFLGVFPIDLIPMSAIKYPCSLVINTKPSSHTGEHWIGLYKDSKNSGVYFDSFGLPPYNLPEVGDVLEHCTEWTFNNKRLQSDFSSVCGEYVIFFITFMSRGHTLDHITYMLSNEDDLYANDALVFSYIKEKYKHLQGVNTDSLQIIDFPFVFNQISSTVSK